MSHLNALQLSLSNERMRLAAARTEGEKALRSVWVTQMEKEIKGEEEFLSAGLDCSLNDDELLELLK